MKNTQTPSLGFPAATARSGQASARRKLQSSWQEGKGGALSVWKTRSGAGCGQPRPAAPAAEAGPACRQPAATQPALLRSQGGVCSSTHPGRADFQDGLLGEEGRGEWVWKRINLLCSPVVVQKQAPDFLLGLILAELLSVLRHTPTRGKSHRCPVHRPRAGAADSILPLAQTDAVTAAQGTLRAAEQTDTHHALVQAGRGSCLWGRRAGG